MNIPNFIDSKVIDENGMLTDTWKQVFTQLFGSLQGGLSDEGIALPNQTTANIAIIADPNKSGATLYNETTNKVMCNFNGVFKNLVEDGGAGSLSQLQLTGLTPDTALISNASNDITSSITTATELSYVHGVTSDIQSQLNGKEPTISAGTSTQYWCGDKSWQTLDTSVVPENTNLYYTDARSRAAISSSVTGLTYTSATGVFSLTASYVIPTTTEESNWNGAYAAAVTNATSLDTPNTLVERDASGNSGLGLNDTETTPVQCLDNAARQLLDSTATAALDWNLLNLINPETGLASMEWGIGNMDDVDGYSSVNWYVRVASDSAGNPSIDWQNRALYAADNTQRYNWNLGQLSDDTGVTAIQFGSGNYLLSAPTTGNVTVDWSNCALNDSSDQTGSIDWQNRLLCDNNPPSPDTFGVTSLDWKNRTLNDTSGNAVINFSTLAEIKIAMQLDPQSSAPSSPTDGMMYVGGALGSRHLYIYLNSAWHTIV